MYIFCVLWVNGAVFKGGGDKIQVEIYIYTCTCKSSCDLKLETFSCLLNALSNDSGFGS